MALKERQSQSNLLWNSHEQPATTRVFELQFPTCPTMGRVGSHRCELLLEDLEATPLVDLTVNTFTYSCRVGGRKSSLDWASLGFF